MRISLLDYTWPQRLLRLALTAILAGGGFWLAEIGAEEFRVSCERQAGMPDCVATSARWGRVTRTELPAGALLGASRLTRTDIDRDGTATTYWYLALETRQGRIISSHQDGAGRAAAEIEAYLADALRAELDVRLANRGTFRLVAAVWSLMLAYLLLVL